MREAEPHEVVGPRDQPLDVGLVELDDVGDQQDLPRHAATRQRRLHPLVDQPLMGGVLVDDHHAVAGLRHDIGLVDLGARGAERPVDRVGLGFDSCMRASADGPPTSNAAWAASAKPAGAPASAVAYATEPWVAGNDRAGGFRQSHPPNRGGLGRNACDGGGAAGRRRARAVAQERVLQRPHDHRAHQPAVAKPHLGLGGMDVHVDLVGVDGDEQRDHGMAVARQMIGIGGAHRPEHELVAHRAAVDEEIEAERIGLAVGRQPGEAFERQPVAAGAHFDGIGAEIGAEHVAEPLEAPRRVGQRRRPRSPARAPRPPR